MTKYFYCGTKAFFMFIGNIRSTNIIVRKKLATITTTPTWTECVTQHNHIKI